MHLRCITPSFVYQSDDLQTLIGETPATKNQYLAGLITLLENMFARLTVLVTHGVAGIYHSNGAD